MRAMRTYELILVLKTSLGEEKRKKFIETIKEWMKPASPNASQGGDVKVTKEESMGQKMLAYPIKKEKDGYYYMMALESAAGVSADFEKKLLTNDAVLRHLVLRTK